MGLAITLLGLLGGVTIGLPGGEARTVGSETVKLYPVLADRSTTLWTLTGLAFVLTVIGPVSVATRKRVRRTLGQPA